ncbi:MAG: RNA-binding S4 domain-containing protein [Christensenellales bacterium]|jgi:ribosomal 50S subunit-recycling heat shock protein
MRLDKYLKVSRIIKRRSVADEACRAGHVSLNGKVAKSSSTVKVGDVIEVRFGQRTTRYTVLNISETVKKDDAALMYRIEV